VNKKDAVKIANLTADLMMVIGRMKRSARDPDGQAVHSGTEFAILDTIQRHGCKTVPEIAAWRGVARQSVQSVVNKLVDAGLILQKENPDHKLSPILVLSPEGRAHYDEARELMWAKYRSARPGLAEGDLEAAERVMAVIAQTWGAGPGDD
jgi:DNA-binding MarR family transcriptional regulator